MSKNMKINRIQKVFAEKEPSPQNHWQYFENLEQRLLEESDKLTNLMGKSLFKEPSHSKLPIASSPSRNLLKTSIKKDPQEQILPKKEVKCLRQAKQLCEILKKPKIFLQEKKYCETSREQADNFQGLKDSTGEALKAKSIFSMLSDSKSLKQTISTDYCKSEKSMRDNNEGRLGIADFEILGYLDEGKFGSVFLGRHRKTGFICALKRLSKALFGRDPTVLTQLIREIKIQSYLDHPNVVQLYTVFGDESYLYLMLELCFSGTLYGQLKKLGRLGQDKIRTIIKQVCHALQYMHDNDILHRDLKPQNILFHEQIVKICDFGWSVNSPLLRNTLCGTPLYTSPQIVQKKHYDNKVDIWNVGVLTYELIFGRVPFDIRKEDDMSKVLEQEIYFPKSYPVSLEITDFIMRCVCKNPRERFTIIQLLDHSFLNPTN